MVAYHENWNILLEWNYDNWEKVWVWTWYYENWEVKSVCNYTYWLEKECYDKNYIDEVILWEQEKNIDENTEVYHINIISPLSESTISSTKFDIIGYIEDLPNSKALIYIDNNLTASTIVDSEWIINQSIENIDSWKHSLKITIQDIDWNILWESDEINFYLS